MKETPKLHKHFDDAKLDLQSVNNENLWFCCSTYG